jgi:hypothetical protein
MFDLLKGFANIETVFILASMNLNHLVAGASAPRRKIRGRMRIARNQFQHVTNRQGIDGAAQSDHLHRREHFAAIDSFADHESHIQLKNKIFSCLFKLKRAKHIPLPPAKIVVNHA